MVVIMKTSFPLTTGRVWAFSLLGGFDASRQADLSLYQHSGREVASRPSTMLARSPQTPREATRPERHQCLGVHNNATLALSQPFVSATLAQREWLSISPRESGGSPSAHPSQVLSPTDGPLPRLFPWLPVCHFHRLDAGPVHYSRPPCACCNYPLHRHTSPGTLVGNFFFLCSGTTGIDCDGQLARKMLLSCTVPPQSTMFDLLKMTCEELRFVAKLQELSMHFEGDLFLSKTFFAPFKPLHIYQHFFFFFLKLQMQSLRIMKNESSWKCLAFLF